jgi:hypothetical protein
VSLVPIRLLPLGLIARTLTACGIMIETMEKRITAGLGGP